MQESNPCSELGIPSHLHTGTRDVDNTFGMDETIYRRFKCAGGPNDWKKNSTLSASVFPVDNDSCNRSKYCRYPEDVLYNTRKQDNGVHYSDHGILGFKVSDFFTLTVPPAPPIKQNGVVRNFTFHLEHQPEVCMYPHTEIWIIDANNRIDTKPPKSTRALIRDRLLSIINIVKEPSS